MTGPSRDTMIVSPHPLATQAGTQVLREGGTAIEAAVAAGAVLAVVCPHFCGLGGDAVWLVADRAGRARSFLGIGQAAKAVRPGVEIPLRGPGSALTTACALDAWRHALDYSQANWGGTRSLPDLLGPAIAHARDGYPVTASQRFWLERRKDEIGGWPGFADVFLPGGGLPDVGRTFVQPQLARTLEEIASDGVETFYRGALARRIVDGLRDVDAPLCLDDLAATRTRTQAPASLDYRGLTLLAPPAPTQGPATLMTMGVLQQFDLSALVPGGAEHLHLVVEAIKQAFLLRGAIADPDMAADAGSDMLAPETIARAAQAVDRGRALDWPHPYRHGDTVYLGAVDAAGNVASVLQSTYFDWGSGVVVGDTGIVWQNRGAAFSSNPAHPNAAAPGKRPFYTLNPGMALKDGKPRLLYGTQGADGQPQTLAMLLTRLIDFGQSPQDALAGPRFLLGRTFSDTTDSLKVEESAGPATLLALRSLGHAVSVIPALSPLAGQAGVIRIEEDGSADGRHDPRG